MIIVNQDRDVIINFNKVQNIWIDGNLDNDFKAFEIYADGELLGFYKTKERAKEVLREIIDTYKFNHCDAVGQKQAVHRMPEE